MHLNDTISCQSTTKKSKIKISGDNRRQIDVTVCENLSGVSKCGAKKTNASSKTKVGLTACFTSELTYKVAFYQAFNRLLLHPNKVSNFIQIDRIVCEVQWLLDFISLPFIASPAASGEVNVTLLLSRL